MKKGCFICFLAIGLFYFFCSSCYAQTGNMVVVGTWKLISIDQVNSQGEVIKADDWMGKKPTGIIIYDTTGYMSVQFMRDPKEEGGIIRYYAYFGTYEVKAKEGVILHNLEGSLMSDEVGMLYRRNFKISGNRLMLTTPKNRRFTFEHVEKGK